MSLHRASAAMARTGTPAAMTIVEAVNQVEITCTTTSGADGQLSGEMRFCARCKSGRLFMTNMHPLQIASAPDAFGDAVAGIARQAINPFYTGKSQRFDR